MVKVGDVVRVVKGKAAGTVGEVFWVGETKYGPRVGLKPDGGDKVWANPNAVVLDAPEPKPVSLVAMAAALDSPAVKGAVAATASNDAVLALTARVAALELLVGKLLAGAPAPAAPEPLFDEPPFDLDEPPPPYGEN